MLRPSAAVSAAAAAAATIAALSDPAYADGYFRFPFLSSPAQTQTSPDTQSAGSRPPGGGQSTASSSSGGFDPESLERGAKALREINSSSHAKQVLDFVVGL